MDTASLRRVHAATGVVPLGAYLLFHAWEHFPIRHGRDALLARVSHSTSPVLEVVFVLLPLLVHAALGISLARDPEGVRAYVSPAFRKLQVATGACAAAFLSFHLITVWLPRLGGQGALLAAYSATLEWTGTAPLLVLHAVGIGAVCTHFGQGLGLALPRLLPALIAPRQGRVLGVLVGAALWLVFLNELSAYATYAPLL
ncbi:MAG: Succinate dehydrogenase [Pseudomonadota bacterium]|jgi:succinate dehydrogenase / fumarate reductase cytochrome b subunit